MKIIYIAGYGRSGSTLLDIILGEKFTSVGEIANLFNHLYFHGTRCSCGMRLGECPFWHKILNACVDSKNGKQYIRLFKKQQSVFAFFFNFISWDKRNKKEFIKISKCLFQSIFESSDCKAIVDSSKTDRNKFVRPFKLFRDCGYDVKIVHLIRDPRKIYESVSKGSNVKMEKGENPEMCFPLFRTIWGWILANAGASLNKALIGRKNSMELRYEDFISDPVMSLEHMEKKFELDLSISKTKIENKNSFSPKHLCGGNRLARNKEIYLEPGYLQAPNISKFKQILIWFLTLPFSYSFGYPLFFREDPYH